MGVVCWIGRNFRYDIILLLSHGVTWRGKKSLRDFLLVLGTILSTRLTTYRIHPPVKSRTHLLYFFFPPTRCYGILDY